MDLILVATPFSKRSITRKPLGSRRTVCLGLHFDEPVFAVPDIGPTAIRREISVRIIRVSLSRGRNKDIPREAAGVRAARSLNGDGGVNVISRSEFFTEIFASAVHRGIG